jgi:hypothetical protein
MIDRGLSPRPLSHNAGTRAVSSNASTSSVQPFDPSGHLGNNGVSPRE